MANWRVGGVYRNRNPEHYMLAGRVPLFVIQEIRDSGEIVFSHKFEGEEELWGQVATFDFGIHAVLEDDAEALLRRLVDLDKEDKSQTLQGLKEIISEARKLLGVNDSVEDGAR